MDSLTLESKEAQAALLLLRWLFAECVLSEDELAATLNLDRATPEGVSHTTTRDSEELPVFRRHQRLACRFARLIPFYLGAHVLISRSLLLQYSATLLMVSDVTQHVRRLEAPLQSNPNYLPYSALHPPSSVEGSLLEWFQAILDSTQKQLREGSAAVAPLASCSALRGFIEHGPFNRDVLDPSERVFFRLVQSGECVCVALWFTAPLLCRWRRCHARCTTPRRSWRRRPPGQRCAHRRSRRNSSNVISHAATGRRFLPPPAT